LKFSELVQGAARFGEVDDDVADRTVGTALDMGITAFDKADIYGAAAVKRSSEWRSEPAVTRSCSPRRSACGSATARSTTPLRFDPAG